MYVCMYVWSILIRKPLIYPGDTFQSIRRLLDYHDKLDYLDKHFSLWHVQDRSRDGEGAPSFFPKKSKQPHIKS